MAKDKKQYQNERVVRISSSSGANDGQAITLEGKLHLLLPTEAKGIVLFAHGSRSSRHSSTRNNYVAEVLHNAGIATLLVDLLTPEEEDADIRTQNILYKLPPGIVLNKFNIKLLAKRLIAATNWIIEDPDTQHLINNIGYFGASTGSAAALIAASAKRPSAISAIVSRGGRPDLAGSEALSKVQAPTLLIVGGNDAKSVIDFNNNALKQLTSVQKKKLIIIPEATHLFEESGTLEEVARLASGWFGCYFLIKKHSSGSNQ